MQPMLLEVTLQGLEGDIISAADSAFDHIMHMVSELLTVNPRTWAENHGIWNIITGMNNTVAIVSSQLAVLFFLIGFVSNSTDLREELTLEKIFKLFLKIGVTQFFIVNSLTIVGYLFEITTGLTGLLSYGNYTIRTTGLGNHMYGMADLSRVVFLFPTILYLIIVPVCAVVVLILALMRLFRIYIAIPYGSLAFSTLASGSRHMENIMPGYIKYLLSVLLEAFSMMIALRIGFSLILGGTGLGFIDLSDTVTDADAHFLPAILILISAMANAILLTVLCKTSQDIAAKALSLDKT